MVLSRIAEYTTRITVTQIEYSVVYSAELGRLIALSRRNQWFPNVVAIHVIPWEHEEMDELHWVYPYYPLFPSLRQIRIDDPYDMTYGQLAGLVDWCATIDRLHIHTDLDPEFGGTDEGVPPALILRFRYLQHVELYLGQRWIDDPSIIHLLSLDSMQYLNIITVHWDLEITSLESGCQKLRKMKLTSLSLDLVQLFYNLRIPVSTLELSLQTYQLFESEETWSTCWQGCIALVVERFRGSLTKLTLSADENGGWPVRREMIQEVKALTNLEELHLDFHFNEYSENLAHALPHLRIFEHYGLWVSKNCFMLHLTNAEKLSKRALCAYDLGWVAVGLDIKASPSNLLVTMHCNLTMGIFSYSILLKLVHSPLLSE
jgi:hypothetical protein